jgi:hypothetical protein
LGSEPVDSWEIVELLERYRPSTGLTVEALSDEAGWELKDVLVDANELWNVCVDEPKDICNRLQLDWQRALPDLPPSLTGAPPKPRMQLRGRTGAELRSGGALRWRR